MGIPTTVSTHFYTVGSGGIWLDLKWDFFLIFSFDMICINGLLLFMNNINSLYRDAHVADCQPSTNLYYVALPTKHNTSVYFCTIML